MIALRIRELRENLHLTQAEFGKQLGVSRDVIGNIEYGRVAPKHIFLNHICKIFHVHKSWLLEGHGEIFDVAPGADKELNEAMEVFKVLSPELQAYALEQLRGLLKVQNAKDIRREND